MLVILQGPRGRGGVPQRGVRGGGGMAGMRGSRGGRPGRGAAGRGQAMRGGAGSRGAQRGGKRKMGGDHNQGQTKKRNTDGNWGAQPIAQQPLNNQEWYTDSYGSQQWG